MLLQYLYRILGKAFESIINDCISSPPLHEGKKTLKAFYFIGLLKSSNL